MGRFKLSAVVGAAIMVTPLAGALAADFPQPPPYIPPPVEVGKSWYLRGHIGLAAQHFKGLEHELFSTPASFEWLNPGTFAAVPTFGVGVGFTHGDHWRFDVTGEYRGKSAFAALDRYDEDSNPPDYEGDTWGINDYSGFKSEWLFLANAYYDIGTWHGVTPYVGAGIGFSRNSIYGFTDNNTIQGGGGWAPTGHNWSLAWALHAGASMQVTNNLSLDLGYSFVSLGDGKTGPFQNQDPTLSACLPDNCTGVTFKGIYSHDVKLGLRWAFDHGVIGTYPPVMAKY